MNYDNTALECGPQRQHVLPTREQQADGSDRQTRATGRREQQADEADLSLRVGAVLKELLNDVVAKDIGHELDRVRQQLREDQLQNS